MAFFFEKMATEQSRAMELLLVAHSVLNGIPYIRAISATYDNHFTNYFYRNGSDLELCIPDTPALRHAAVEMGVDHMVWFGHNSDSVDIVSLNEVTRSIQLAPAS